MRPADSSNRFVSSAGQTSTLFRPFEEVIKAVPL
jgi:hypothetical protein